MEQQLLTYIEQELKRGVAPQMIRKALRDAGWSDSLIEESFVAVQTKLIPPSPNSVIPPREEMIPGDEDEPEQTGKKNNKPIIIVVSVFFGMIVIVAALISYFSLSTPSQIVEIEPPAKPQVEEAPAKVTVEEPTAPADNDIVKVKPVPIVPATTTIPATTTVAATTTMPLGLDTVQGRDERRKSDMKKLVEAQKAWYQAIDQYYTCGLQTGDCKGRPYGYPAQIGKFLPVTPLDPLTVQYLSKKAVCGKDYVYCGLNNTPYPQFFCYYAKLEGGGYYTASHNGNFTRKTPPKLFEECAAAN